MLVKIPLKNGDGWLLGRHWGLSCQKRLGLFRLALVGLFLESLPSLRDIRGPYVLERVVSDWWGLSPNSRRFPMMGRGRGPGGSLAWKDFRWVEPRMRKWKHNQTKQGRRSRRTSVVISIAFNLCLSCRHFSLFNLHNNCFQGRRSSSLEWEQIKDLVVLVETHSKKQCLFPK